VCDLTRAMPTPFPPCKPERAYSSLLCLLLCAPTHAGGAPSGAVVHGTAKQSAFWLARELRYMRAWADRYGHVQTRAQYKVPSRVPSTWAETCTLMLPAESTCPHVRTHGQNTLTCMCTTHSHVLTHTHTRTHTHEHAPT